MSAFPEESVRTGESQPVVLQVELSTAQPTREVVERWVTIIEAVGSVAGQEVRVVDVSPTARSVPLEAQIEQHFKTRLGDLQLTPQEQEVTELSVVYGKTGRQIAKTMGLAEGTVRNIMSNILRKTGSAGRGGLAFKVLGVGNDEAHTGH